MNAIRRYLASRAARRLAQRGHDVQRQRILSKARELRRELGMPQHPALET